MTLEEIKTMLEASGLPVAYRSFPEGNAPDLPYICFLTNGNNNFGADGCVYHSALRITIELYTRNKDMNAESAVESALSGFYWEKAEEYLEDEKCYEILYTMEV